MTVCVFNPSKIETIETISGTEINPRCRFVKISVGGTEFDIGTVHLASGTDDKDYTERIEELTNLFKS